MSNLHIYSIKIKGNHPKRSQEIFYGVAGDIDQAMFLLGNAAESQGWSNIEYEDISKIGSLSFFGCPVDDQGFFSEIEKCKA